MFLGRPCAVVFATTLVGFAAALGQPLTAHAAGAARANDASASAPVRRNAGADRARTAHTAASNGNASLREPWRVQVTIVTSLADDGDFRSLVAEWFQLNSIRAEIRQMPELNPTEVLSAVSDSTLLRIWVTFVRVDGARLYFVEPSGRRFLLRDVPLRAHFDEFSREQLAQVIVTSANAFMERRASTSAEDFTRALKTSVSRREPTVLRSESPAKLVGSAPAVLPTIGVFYQLQLQRGATVMHGPGLALGAAYPAPGYRLLAALKAQYSWSRTVELPELDLDLSAVALRAVFGVAHDLSTRAQAGVELGGGVDYVSFAPSRGRDMSVEPTAPASLWRPALTLDLRSSLVAGHTRWSLLLGASVYLQRSEYAVSREGTARVVYSPFPVEPKVAFEADFE